MEHDADVVAIGTGTGPGGETVPAVILAVREECLPIFVSPDQAQSIGMALEGEPFERPLSHDLLLELLTEFGGAVNRVRIDDLIDGTFYAKVDVERYDEGHPERFVFDARPSDALALAARVDCPIVVTDDVVEEAGQPPEVVGFDVGEPRREGGLGDVGSEVEPAPGESRGEDVSDVARDERDEASDWWGDDDESDDGDHNDGDESIDGDRNGDGENDDGDRNGGDRNGGDGGDPDEFEGDGVAERGDDQDRVDEEGEEEGDRGDE